MVPCLYCKTAAGTRTGRSNGTARTADLGRAAGRCTILKIQTGNHRPRPMSPAVKFMEVAIGLATENVLSGAGGPFGAVVVRDGLIIAQGANEVTATND